MTPAGEAALLYKRPGRAAMPRNLAFRAARPQRNASFACAALTLPAALLILLLLPYRDVTQPAYSLQRVLEYLLPGISPQWRQWGGLALVTWAALLLQWLASLARIGTVAFGGFPNTQRAFGVPVTAEPVNVFQLNAPYVVAGIVLLYTINAVLVRRSNA